MRSHQGLFAPQGNLSIAVQQDFGKVVVVGTIPLHGGSGFGPPGTILVHSPWRMGTRTLHIQDLESASWIALLSSNREYVALSLWRMDIALSEAV